MNEIVSNAIQRAKETDRGFEILRDTLGQKPAAQLRVHDPNECEIVITIDEE